MTVPPPMEVADELHARLLAVEADLEADRYRTGTWDGILRALRRRPRVERLALSAEVSRVSRKLHGRSGIRTMPVAAGLVLEGAGTLIACAVLSFALRNRSNLAALLAAVVLVTTFQPLIKVMIGTALGISYDYAYLRGIEPRFKMRYGTYVAAPRWVRIALHISGMVGSPLAAWLVGRLVAQTLPLTSVIASATCWVMVLLNVLFLVTALTGRRRLGSLRLSITSGGVAGAELREALFDS